MHVGEAGDNLHRHELHALQKALRVRATHVKKIGKRQGLIRPLSKDDIDTAPAGFRKPVTLVQNGQVISKAPRYLFDPEGYFFSIWNFLAVFLIVGLVFYLPVLSGFFDEPTHCNYLHIWRGPAHNAAGIPGHQLNWGWQLFPVITNYFFLVDILIHCFTAIKIDGSVKEHGLRSIWRKYLKTWFFPDAIACLPLECILFTAAPRVNWYNTPNFVRLVRVASIHRRAHGSPFRVFDRFSSVRQEFSYSARRIAMAAFAECVAMHWFACVLWWTIRLENYPANTWPSLLGLVHVGVAEQYCWSIFVIVSAAVQNTWGGYNPVTWGEALVWIFAMVTVAVLFAVMVGFIVAIIKSSGRAEARYKDRMDNVMDAMDSRDVSEDTKERVMQFYKHMYKGGQNWFHDSILRELPYDMQVEAALHSAQGLLSKVSLIAEEPTLMERVALMLHPSYALKGEGVLKQGWPGRSMYFLRSGFVDLVMDGAVVDTVQPGDFFGEVALLALSPSHELLQESTGVSETISSHPSLFPSIFTARALTNCSMYVLNAEEFHQAAEEYPAVKVKLEAWAVRHAKKLLKFNIDLRHESPELLKVPQDSFTVPPDTPTESLAATPSKQDAQSSSSIMFPDAATPTHQSASSALHLGLSEHSIASNSSTGNVYALQGGQPSSDLTTKAQPLVRLPSRRSEEARRSFTARRSLQGLERRVFADSATILSFADVRGSIDVPNDA